MNKLFSFDVSLEMLEGFRINKSEKTEFILDFMKMFWMGHNGGNDPDYWNKVRVGSVDVYLDDGNQLHLDFVTRFHLDNHPELLEILKKINDA